MSGVKGGGEGRDGEKGERDGVAVRGARPFAVPSASALASASASHRSVIKNDEGKYIMGARYRSTARRRG